MDIALLNNNPLFEFDAGPPLVLSYDDVWDPINAIIFLTVLRKEYSEVYMVRSVCNFAFVSSCTKYLSGAKFVNT